MVNKYCIVYLLVNGHYKVATNVYKCFFNIKQLFLLSAITINYCLIKY